MCISWSTLLVELKKAISSQLRLRVINCCKLYKLANVIFLDVSLNGWHIPEILRICLPLNVEGRVLHELNALVGRASNLISMQSLPIQ